MAAMDKQSWADKRFTGWHMAAIMVAFFAVVIAVNLLMARLATGTFGGVVVENSYVASQHFNRWLDAEARQDALGWKMAVARGVGGQVAISLEGVPAFATVMAEARHPLGRHADVPLTFVQQADGRFLSREVLPAGRWLVRVKITADGHVARKQDTLN